MTASGLVEHFFRHEYGKLVARLSRRVGVQHLAEVEDAVQSALMTALEGWAVKGQPDNPSAWLYAVAYKKLTGEVRQGTRRRHILSRREDERAEREPVSPEVFLGGEVQDDLLRMLFHCCDEELAEPSQMALALKTLCGFDVREISLRLFVSEANVYKRLGRARARLAATGDSFEELTREQYSLRLPAVHRVLYLLFTEGYLSSHAEMSIRRELCDEAIRLTQLLVEHPLGAAPESSALLALLHLHAARLPARQGPSGGLLLLEEQDREQWDPREIELGLFWLARSAEGERFSRYHAEAGIAAEHCLAPSFQSTNWQRVVSCYELLEREAPSALHRMNRAVAVAEWRGAESGLALLVGLEPPSWLAGSYLWAAVHADLHRRCGDTERARRYRASALDTAPSSAIRELLQRRLIV